MTEGDVLEPVQAALASGEPDPAGRKIVGMGVWPVARLDHHGVREFATDSGWRKLDVVRCLAGLLRQNRWALFSPLVFVLRGAMASQLPRLERPGATSPDFSPSAVLFRPLQKISTIRCRDQEAGQTQAVARALACQS